jgi:hypothetical protein
VRSVPVIIPKYGAHKKIPQCRVGEPFDYLVLLRAFSGRFSATIDSNNRRMEIFAACNTPCGEKVFSMFVLRIAPDFSSFGLKRTDPEAKVGALVDEFCRPGDRQPGGHWLLHFIPSNAYRPNDPTSTHPYDVLCRVVQRHLRTHGTEVGTRWIQENLWPLLSGELNKRTLNLRARSEVAKVLSEWTGGSVEVRYTLIRPDPKWQPCGENRWLWGLTVVFPWAIDLLVKRPNCLMTDSTFRSLKPYTLPILHAIVANESLPIAFGISPTETAESYHRLYDHISRLRRNLCVSLSQYPPVVNSNCRPDNSRDEWPEDPATVREDDLSGDEQNDQDEQQVPVDVPVVDASVLPKSDSDTIHDILCSLPLLTDQGPALAKFVEMWHLDWKLCHRHIIEALKADSLIAEWGARILRSYSPEEWRKTCDVVEWEMKRMTSQYLTSGKEYTALQKLLGHVEPNDTHHLADMSRWALWLRPGCPRTTNSAESVNGHLNADIKGAENDFFERLRIVVTHFINRYRSRNSWCDRALKRNASKCWPSEATKALPWFSEKRREFYVALHNAAGLQGPVKRHFPAEDIACMLFPGWTEDKSRSPLDTDSPSADENTKRPDPDAKRIVLKADACHTVTSHLAWQICQSLRHRLRRDQWANHTNDIYERVVQVIARHEVPPDGPLSPDLEGACRA